MPRLSLARLAAVIPWALACSTVDETGSNHYDEAAEGEPTYGEEVPQSEPNGITFTALDFAQPYSRLAVGNVVRGVNQPGCCLDYVLAGPATEDMRVVFGGGLADGLTFLDDRPDEVLPVGPMDDVLLLDLDEDGRNDLLGLRPEGGNEVVVRLGVALPGAEGPFLNGDGVATPTVVVQQGQQVAEGYRDFASGDLDCDGHVDLAIAAPGSDAVVTLLGRGDGSFKVADSSGVDVDEGHGSVRVLVAQLDGDGGEDVATVNDDGSLSVLLANDCSGEFLDPQRVVLKLLNPEPCDAIRNCWKDTDSAVVIAGDFCSPPGLDLAYAFEEQVWIVCGDEGDFLGVGEQAHGGAVEDAPAADYFFDLDGPSSASPNGRTDDALVWDNQLYILRVPPTALALQGKTVFGSHRLIRLPIDLDQVEQGLGQPVLTLYAETPRIFLHRAAVDDPTLRLVWPALGMARWEQP